MTDVFKEEGNICHTRSRPQVSGPKGRGIRQRAILALPAPDMERFYPRSTEDAHEIAAPAAWAGRRCSTIDIKTGSAIIQPMCGRFYLTATPAELKKTFNIDSTPGLVPRYNIAPAQFSPIVIPMEKGRSVRMARWGLVPSWSRDLSLGAGMINAPAETLERKPAYRTAFDTRRCLVPASGFYEWQTMGAKNQPYKIAARNRALFAFAGLSDRWVPEVGEPVETFTIITTQANRLVSEVHDRMPVIIAPANSQRWLTAPANTAKKLLVPYTGGMTIAPVSGRVSSVSNDDAELLRPVAIS
jgi:putative SOS response-associated peptidase YedK